MNKSTNIMIRISELDKEKIKEIAEQKQMSMSEWILFTLRKEIEKSK